MDDQMQALERIAALLDELTDTMDGIQGQLTDGLRALVAVQFYALDSHSMRVVRPEIAEFMGWE